MWEISIKPIYRQSLLAFIVINFERQFRTFYVICSGIFNGKTIVYYTVQIGVIKFTCKSINPEYYGVTENK